MPAQVVDSTTISATFPNSARYSVRRDHIVDTIFQMLEDASTEIVLVEGVDGIGKTTLLAQVAMRTADCGLNLFVRPLSSLATDPDYLMSDLANQAHYILFGELRADALATEAEFRALITGLQALARRSGRARPIVVVVDGLADFEESQRSARDELVRKVLPFGLPEFRFVVAGGQDALPENLLRRSEVRHCSVPLFSLGESKEIFSGLGLDEGTVEAIYREARKMPGLMASFRREIEAGQTPSTLLKDAPKDLQGYVAREWASIEISDVVGKLAGLVAFAQRPYTLAEAATLLDLSTNAVVDLLREIRHIVVNEPYDELEYVTEAHRKHASQLLKSRRNEVIDLIISRLSDTNRGRGDEELISYLKIGGRNAELAGATSGEFLAHRLDASGSFLPVLRHSSDGLAAAVATGDPGEIFRLALLSSTLLELDGRGTLKAHIDALTALGDVDGAIALAQSAPIIEDRIASLAAICSKLKQVDVPRFDALKSEVESQLKRLLQDNDTIATRRFGDLVASTLDVSPELAYQLIEHAEADRMRARSLNPQVARGAPDGAESPYVQDAMDGRGANVDVRSMLRAVTRFSSTKDAAEIFSIVESLGSEQQLFFLLRWLEGAGDRIGAIDVVDRCLQIIVENDKYVATARDFRLIAGAIASFASQDTARSLDLVRKTDALSAASRGRSRTAEVVRLDLELFRAEMRQPVQIGQLPKGAVVRLSGVLERIDELEDAPTRAHCFALVLTILLSEADVSAERAEQIEPVIRVVEQNHDHAVNEVIVSCANHYDLLQDTISTLAQAGLSRASEISARLNTEDRRDAAFAEVGTQMLESRPNGLSLGNVLGIIERVSNDVMRRKVSADALELLADDIRELPKDVEEALRQRFEAMRAWEDPATAARALAAAAVVLARAGSGLSERVARWAVERVSDLEILPVRVAIGYQVAETLAAISPAIARDLVSECDRARQDAPEASSAIQTTLSQLAGLEIRAFGGLVLRKAVPQGYLDQICENVTLLESQVQRLPVYAKFAATCIRSGDQQLGMRLMEQWVIPELHRLKVKDAYARLACLIDVLPVLYATHQDVAAGLLGSLPLHARDQAVEAICHFLFYRVLRGEPIVVRSPELIPLDYPTTLKILGVLAFSRSDSQLANFCSRICISITKQKGGVTVTREQQSDVAARIERLAAEKLPDPRNILHDGYLILFSGMAIALRGSNGEAWKALFGRVNLIPNQSDQVYVLASLTEYMPGRLNALRKEFLHAAIAMVDGNGSALDAIDRYETIAQAARPIDTRISRECIHAAVSVVGRGVSGPVDKHLQSILELAHGVDPALAERLAKQMDDDPARERRTSTSFGEHVGILKARDDLEKPIGQSRHADMPLVQVIEMARSHMASLNAHRMSPINTERSVPFVASAGTSSLHGVEAVYSWVVLNEVLRPAGDATFLRQIVGSCGIAAAVARRVAAISVTRDQRSRKASELVIGRVSRMVARPGSREQVHDVLRQFAKTKLSKYLKVADPYFGPMDLSIVRIMLEECSECRVEVMTSLKHQREEGITEQFARHYRDYWRSSVADGLVPDVDVYVVGLGGTGQAPIHDRWILTEGAGLRLGASIHSIGLTKVSEVSEIDEVRAAELVQLFDSYAMRRVREQEGQRISFEGFSLRDSSTK